MNKPHEDVGTDGTLRVVRIIEGTSVDGPGLRTSIYFAGCHHRCHGCHNPTTWDFNSGDEMSVGDILDIVTEYGLNVTFTGGDPMYRAGSLLPLARSIKAAGFNIWCYTGFSWEELMEDKDARALLDYADVVVDGPYIERQRDTSLIFRGSSNQRLIDVGRSVSAGDVILFEPDVALM